MLRSRLLLFCEAACRQGRPADRSQAEDQSVRAHPACHVSRVPVLLVTGLGVLVAVRALHDTLGQAGGRKVANITNCSQIIPPAASQLQCTNMCASSQLSELRVTPQAPSAIPLCSRVGSRSLQVGQIAGLPRRAGLGRQAPPADGVNGAYGRSHTAATIACCTAVLDPWAALGGWLQARHSRGWGRSFD